jgi:hypothetical protein
MYAAARERAEKRARAQPEDPAEGNVRRARALARGPLRVWMNGWRSEWMEIRKKSLVRLV